MARALTNDGRDRCSHGGGQHRATPLLPTHLVHQGGQEGRGQRCVGSRHLEVGDVDLREQPGQPGEVAHRTAALGTPGQVRLELEPLGGSQRPQHVGAVEMGEAAGHAPTPISCNARRSARRA